MKEPQALMVAMKKYVKNWDTSKYVGELVFVLGARFRTLQINYSYGGEKQLNWTNCTSRKDVRYVNHALSLQVCKAITSDTIGTGIIRMCTTTHECATSAV